MVTESLQPDAHGVSLSTMLSEWCATRDRRQLRRWYPAFMARAEGHLQALLQRPLEDRAAAAKQLLDSLDGEVDADAESARAKEIDRSR